MLVGGVRVRGPAGRDAGQRPVLRCRTRLVRGRVVVGVVGAALPRVVHVVAGSPPAAWKDSTMRFWRRSASPTITVARIAKTKTR